MSRIVQKKRKTINTIVAWSIGLLIFFPVLWTVLTSFKTEGQAINDPPLFLFFDWTLENYSIVQERSDYMKFLWNSIIVAGGSTILGILIAIPAAWSMAFVPTKRTKDILLWMLSTKITVCEIVRWILLPWGRETPQGSLRAGPVPVKFPL